MADLVAPDPGLHNASAAGPENRAAGPAPLRDVLALHTHPDREEILRRSIGAPPYYDPAVRAWIVLDAKTGIALLRDPRLVAPKMALDLLEGRYGTEFPNLRFVERYLVVFLDGQPHAEERRRAAQLLAEGRQRARARLPEFVQRHFSPLDRAGEVELVAECVTPFVAEYFAALLGATGPLPYVPLALAPTMDRFASLRMVQRVEAEIAATRALLPGLGLAADPGLMLTLLILGRDTTLGTVADSLAALVRAQGGQLLSRCAYPPSPPRTGVPATERLVTESFSLGGQTFAVGDRVRLYFHGLTVSSDPADHALLFGAGPHNCLGRAVALDVWQSLTGYLATLPRRVELMDLKYRPSTLFAMPERVDLRIS